MTNRKKFFIAVLGLLLLAVSPLTMWAQNSACFSGQVVQPNPPYGTGQPAANALVYVCPSTSTGVPCTPTATVYTDPTLAHTRAVPFATDSNGNWTACVGGNSGSYIVQAIPVPGTTYSTFVTASTGSFPSLAINGNTLTAAPGSATIAFPSVNGASVAYTNVSQTFTGSDTVTGAWVYNNTPTFNTGITGIGNTGDLTAGPGITGAANTFTAAQTALDIILGGPSIDPRYYGVVADGFTNNVTTMKAAVEAACASGKALNFPTGTVLVTYTGNDELTVPTGCTLVLNGQSSDASVLQFGPSPPTTYYYGFHVQAGATLIANNIAIDGPANSGGGGDGGITTEGVLLDYGPGTQGFYCNSCKLGGQWFLGVNRQQPSAGVTDDSTTKATMYLNNADVTVYYEGLGPFGGPQQNLNGCSMAATSNTLTCTDATFTAGLVGANIAVNGAGAGPAFGSVIGAYAMPLRSTIATYVSPTQVTLADAAITTVGAATTVTDGAMQADRTATVTVTANSKSISCSSCFLAADAGRFISIPGAGIGGATWTGQIKNYINASNAILLLPAPTSSAGAAATIKGDGKFTTSQYTFTAGDVGKPITVPGAGASGGALSTIIAAFITSSTVRLQIVAQTTVSSATVTIPGGPATYGVGQYWLTVKDSNFHDKGYIGPGLHVGYWIYTHPNWNLDIDGNTFGNSGRMAFTVNSGGAIRNYLLPAYSIFKNNSVYGFGLSGGLYTGSSLLTMLIQGNTFTLGGNAISVQSGAEIYGNVFNLTAGAAVTSALGTGLWFPYNVDIKHNSGYFGGSSGLVSATTPGMTYNIQGNDVVGATNQPLITNANNGGMTVNVVNNQFSGYRASDLRALYGWNTFDSNMITGVVNDAVVSATATANLRSLRISRNTISQFSGGLLATGSADQPGLIQGGDNCADGGNAPNGVGGGWGNIEPCRKMYPGTISSATTLYLGGSNYGELWTAYSYNAYHITGTTAIQTIVIDQPGRDTYFGGSISLIADGAWSLISGGNIVPCNTGAFAAGSVVTLTHDPRTSTWYQACGVNILPAANGGTGVNSTATFPSSGTVAITSQLALKGTLTTTAATSDAVTITGVSATSVCLLTATNASAATNIATTYISAVAANTVTVTHTATASMTYNLLCTPN